MADKWDKYGAAPAAGKGDKWDKYAYQPIQPRGISIPLTNSQGVIKAPGLDVKMGTGAKIATAPLRLLGGGMENTGQGLTRMSSPQSVEDFAGGTSQTIRGQATTALPFVAPAMVANPMASLSGLVFGGLGGAATEGGLKLLGVPEGYSELAGTLAGFGLGNRGVKLAEDLKASGIMPRAGKAAWEATKAALGHTPGIGRPGRAAMGAFAKSWKAGAPPAASSPGSTVDMPSGYDVAKGASTSKLARKGVRGAPPPGLVPPPSGVLPGTTFPEPEPPVYPPGFQVGQGTTSGPIPHDAYRYSPPGTIPPPGGLLPGTELPPSMTPPPPGFEIGTGDTTGPIPPGAPRVAGPIPSAGGLLPNEVLPPSTPPLPPGFEIGSMGDTNAPIPPASARAPGVIPPAGGLLPGVNLPPSAAPLPPGFEVGIGDTTGPIPAGTPASGPIPPAGGVLPGTKFPGPPPGFEIGAGTTTGPIPAGAPAPGLIPPPGGALPGTEFPAELPPGFGVGASTTSGPIPSGAPRPAGYQPPVSGALPGQKIPLSPENQAAVDKVLAEKGIGKEMTPPPQATEPMTPPPAAKPEPASEPQHPPEIHNRLTTVEERLNDLESKLKGNTTAPEDSIIHKPPEGMPQRYKDMIPKHGETGAQNAWNKDISIAKHLQSEGLTPEEWLKLKLEEQNKYVDAAGKTVNKRYKPLGTGGSHARTVQEGIQHIYETFRELPKAP